MTGCPNLKCYCPSAAHPNTGCACSCHVDFYTTQDQQIRQAVDDGELYGYIKSASGMHPVVMVTATDKHVSVRALDSAWVGVAEFSRSQFYMVELYPGQLAEMHKIAMHDLGLRPEEYRMSGG